MSQNPVVALHGIGSDGRTFDALSMALAKPRFRSLNLPGYADEPGLPESFEGLKAWLGDQLAGAESDTDADTDTDGGRSVLVGYSIGGMLALDFALDHPERVAALVLICTTPAFGGPDPSFKEAFLKARLAGLDAGQTMAQSAPGIVAGYLGERADDAAIELATEMAAAIPETTFRAVLKTLVTFNRRDDLGAVVPPCLIVAGSKDANAPAKTMVKMADRIPRTRFVEFDAGHGLPMECPEDLAQAIQAFLNDFEL